MTQNDWTNWLQTELADLAQKLGQQGFHSTLLRRLDQEHRGFHNQWQRFQKELDRISNGTQSHPDGYHWFSEWQTAKKSLLLYTNSHRAKLLGNTPPLLAESA